MLVEVEQEHRDEGPRAQLRGARQHLHGGRGGRGMKSLASELC